MRRVRVIAFAVLLVVALCSERSTLSASAGGWTGTFYTGYTYTGDDTSSADCQNEEGYMSTLCGDGVSWSCRMSFDSWSSPSCILWCGCSLGGH